MRQFLPIPPTGHPTRLAGLLCALAFLASGCSSIARPPSEPPITAHERSADTTQPELIPVIRLGRYTLVELAPKAAQQDLLLQVVDVAIPDTQDASVEDAMRHVLKRSGYQLCAGQDQALLALPLPVAHYRIGPVTLRDALLMLAGPAWDLQVDDGTRQVCFNRALPVLPDVAEQAGVMPLAVEAQR